MVDALIFITFVEIDIIGPETIAAHKYSARPTKHRALRLYHIL